jgi:L-malate glycosyltransferase
LVVGMRLHSLIFATVGGAPVIGISYDIKVDSFIRDIGSAACLPLNQLSANMLKEQIDLINEAGFRQAPEAAARLRLGEQININSVKELLT